jgi:hypothetical protein
MSASLEKVMQLRLVVARVGEMDLAGWWNTNGQLGSTGATVLRRGFPRTHRFAAARSVFAVAAARCLDLYDPPATVTLWKLPAEIEDQLEQQWELWIDDAETWEPLFAELESCTSDLESELVRLGLISSAHIDVVSKLRRSAEQRAVAVPGEFSGLEDDYALLALAFTRGEISKPAVPYQSLTGP